MNDVGSLLALTPPIRDALASAGWFRDGDPTPAATSLLREIVRGPDPDGAVDRLRMILEEQPDLGRDALTNEDLGRALVAVIGATRALSTTTAADPSALRAAAAPGELDLAKVLAAGDSAELVQGVHGALLTIAARDLTGTATMPEVGRLLSDVADAAAGTALGLAREASEFRFAVIAMGKWGGRELNYASDIDVLFVYDATDADDPVAAASDATRIAQQFLAILGGRGNAGIAFRVDANLRPEGRSGPLARTVESYSAYWERWADTWEMQALIKARVAAGDLELGTRFLAAAEPHVYPETLGAEAVESIRSMKTRAEEAAARVAGDEIKRGVGGIRDIEFSVQLLQLVHGRADADLRHANTLAALAVLHDSGYVRPEDAEILTEAYTWLRDVEHRLQMVDLRQTHELPAGSEERDAIAKAMGYRDHPGQSALGQFDDHLVARRAEIRTIHQRLFYRPLLEAFAESPTVKLTEAGAARQLAALGFLDVEGARRAFSDLTAGLSRRSRLMQQLLPLMLDWLSNAPDPDLGLEQLRLLVTSTADNAQLVATMRDNPVAAERLCTLLGTSRLLGRLLDRIPGFLARLGDDWALSNFRTREQLITEAERRLTVREDPTARLRSVRRLVAATILWIAGRDLTGTADQRWVGRALADLADAAAAAALRHAQMTVGASPRMAVIAMGKWGGGELNYASDLDAILVFEPGDDPESDAETALRVATEFVGAVRAEGPTPGFQIDLDLRPEGKRGALIRSLDSYRAYYERWADTWEFQALLRARIAAGDEELGARFLEMVEPFLYRDDFSVEREREVRRMKVRIEQERIPPGEDAAFHMKLGRGSLSDVEWTVQLLQLRHGAADPSVRTPSTLEGLEALRDAELLTGVEAAVLAEAYGFCARVRNRLFLQAGKQRDSLPADATEVGRLARSLGYLRHPRTTLRERYRRVTRRARRVTEERFYGDHG